MAGKQGELALERDTAGSEVEALPAGWCWATISDVCGKPQYGWTTKAANAGNLKFLRTTDISSGVVDWKTVPYCTEVPNDIDKYLLHTNDIVVSRAGSVGKSFIIKNTERAVFASYLVRLRPKIDPEYVHRFMGSLNYWNQIWDKSSGIAIPNVNGSKLGTIELPLPPLAEQRRIVDRIDELFSRIEAGERAVEAARAGLKRYRKALLKAAVTGALTEDWRDANAREAMSGEGGTGSPSGIATKTGESGEALLAHILTERAADWEAAELAKLKAKGKPATGKALTALRQKYKPPAEPDPDGLADLPEGWVWARVDHLCPDDTGNGISVAGSLEPPGIPALRLDAITENGFDYSKRRYIQISKEKADKLAIRAGHLYVSRANGSKTLMGRAILAKEPPELIVYPDTIIRFGILSGWAEWLNTIWPSHLVRDFLEDKAKTSAGIWKIAQSDIKPMPVPLPPAAEQAEIVSRVEEALSRADAAEAALEAQTRAARALKQSILKAAFTGKLVPQNPKDEPASELLKRAKDAGK